MKKYTHKVGIDVSKLRLDFTLLSSENAQVLLQSVVANSPKGIASLLSTVKKLKIDLTNVLFCFEDTGVYSLPLCYSLAQKQLDFWMVPAIEIKR